MNESSRNRVGRIGRVRLTLACPNCGGMVVVKDHVKVSSLLIQQRVQCVDFRCSWSGVATTEMTKTISPPAIETGPLPGRASQAEIEAMTRNGELI